MTPNGLALLEQAAREQKYLEGWRIFYHPVATVAEVDAARTDEMGRQAPLGVELLGQRLVVARLNGEIVTMNGTCPHRSTSLARGWVNESCSGVICRYHGFDWRYDGKVGAIPALEIEGHKLPEGDIWQIKTFPTVVRGGLVWVSLSDNPIFPVIEIPEEDDPTFVFCPISQQNWEAGIGRMVEAALDNYHFAFTHQSTGLGHPSNPRAPKATVKVEDGYLTIDYVIDQPVNETTSSLERIKQGGFEPVHYQMWARPNAVRLLKTSSIGRYTIVVGTDPIAPLKSRFYRLLYRDFRTDEPHSIWYDLEERINAEDKFVVESMRPWELTVDLDAELQMVMDRPTVNYRKWLAELGLEFL